MAESSKMPLTYPHPAGTILLYDFTDDSEDGYGA